MREALIVNRVVGMLGVVLLAGCSALIDLKGEGQQCTSNDDCMSAKLGDSCQDHVCVETSATATGDAGRPSDGSCSRESDCSDDLPRCFNGACVSADIADRFLCAAAGDDGSKVTYSGTVHYSVQILEYVTRRAPKNIVVKACSGTDVNCRTPIASFTDTLGNGLVELDLPKGFLGYFEVSSDATPAVSYVTKALTEDTRDRDLQIPSAASLEGLAAVAGVTVDQGKGLVLLEAFDCAAMSSGGVQFVAGSGMSEATPFFIVNGVPNREALVSVYNSDTDVSDGGFINMSPGFVNFTARYGVDGPLLGSFNANIRAGTVSFIDMYL